MISLNAHKACHNETSYGSVFVVSITDKEQKMQCTFSEGPKDFGLVNGQWLQISHQLCYHSVRISLSFEPLNPGTDFSALATKALIVIQTSGLLQPPATDTKSLSQCCG